MEIVSTEYRKLNEYYPSAKLKSFKKMGVIIKLLYFVAIDVINKVV
jgi:hypothetical protein